MAPRILLAVLAFALPAFGAYTEFYVQPTGSNLNAGSTSNNTAAFTYASGSWVASTGVFTVASGNPQTDGVAVGDFASVYDNSATATGFSGRVTARDATTITVSLSAIHGTAPADGTSNRTLKIGGAWAGPSGSSGFPFGTVKSTATNPSSDPVRVNFKTGTTYSVTAAMTHANAGPIFWEAYQTTVGDHGAQAVIDGGSTGTAYTVLTVSGNSNSFQGFTFQNNGNSGSAANLLSISSAGCIVRQCTFKNSWGKGTAMTGLNEIIYYECEATNNHLRNVDGSSVGGIGVNVSGTLGLRCIAWDNTLDGFSTDGGILLSNCISANNGSSGAGSTGDENLFVVSSDFYANGDNGYSLGDGSQDQMNCIWLNNNFIDNAGYGLRTNTQPTPGLFLNNGFGSGTIANGSGGLQYDKWFTSSGTVNYTADTTPYAAPASFDFDVTGAEGDDAGYGAFLQIHPSYSGTVGYPAIGASQQ